MITVSSYAKTYDELMKDAESYEEQKEWFYALGAYHDAINSSENPEIAKQKYNQLSKCIKSGKPGYGEFNIFSMHDEWVNLIKNAEKYFTETFPYKILYGDLNMDSADYKTKTANYKLNLFITQSDFYKDALNILQEGYSNTNHSDWTDLESENKELWFNNDYVGIHNFGITGFPILTGIYKKSTVGTELEKIEKVESFKTLQSEIVNIYNNDKVALVHLASILTPLNQSTAKRFPGTVGISVCETPAFAACFSSNGFWNRNIEGSFGSIQFFLPFFNDGEQTCYDIKLAIYDDNDDLILEGTRQTICINNYSYSFNKIPQEKLSVIDSRKYKIKLIGIWLNYGVYDISLMTDEDIENNTIRGVLKSLPDIQLNIDNIYFIDKAILEKQRHIDEQNKAKKEAEQIAKEKAEWDIFIYKMKEKYTEYNQQVVYIDSILSQIGNTIGVEFAKYDSKHQDDRRRTGCSIKSVTKKSTAAKAKLTEETRLVEINGTPLFKIAQQLERNIQICDDLGTLINEAEKIFNDYYKPEVFSGYEKEKYENDKNTIVYLFSNVPELEEIETFGSGTKLSFDKMIEIGKYKNIQIVIP
jgi:hypothetical protein